MFPKLKLTSELIYSTNMRFMQFDAYDEYALELSKFEEVIIFINQFIINFKARKKTRFKFIVYVSFTVC